MNNRQTSTIWLGALSTIVLMSSLFGQCMPPATYLLEGQMLDRDVAVNGQCQFLAELWDQKVVYGARIGPVQVYDVALEQGRFRNQLNEHGEFGPSAFRNRGYWLELGVKCSGDSDFVRGVVLRSHRPKWERRGQRQEFMRTCDSSRGLIQGGMLQGID